VETLFRGKCFDIQQLAHFGFLSAGEKAQVRLIIRTLHTGIPTVHFVLLVDATGEYLHRNKITYDGYFYPEYQLHIR
jgi:hypothetical protein